MANYDVFIGGKKVASPSACIPALQDLVTNSTRVGGKTMRANFLAVKRGWQITWTNITQAEADVIFGEIENRFEFKFKLYDPVKKLNHEGNFYKGDRQYEKLQYIGNEVYHTFSVTFIEC